MTICRAVGVEGGGAGVGKEEEQDPAWVQTIAVIWHQLCHRPFSRNTPLPCSHLWKWSRLGYCAGGHMQRKVGAVGSEITSCFSLNISVAGSEGFWTSTVRVSHNQTSSLLALPPRWVTPPLICSDWLRDTEDWERERDWGNRERQRYSLSTHTHWNEPGREKNASTQRTVLFCTSTTFSAEPAELPSFFTIQELLISIVDCTTCPWHWGCW